MFRVLVWQSQGHVNIVGKETAFLGYVNTKLHATQTKTYCIQIKKQMILILFACYSSVCVRDAQTLNGPQHTHVFRLSHDKLLQTSLTLAADKWETNHTISISAKPSTQKHQPFVSLILEHSEYT